MKCPNDDSVLLLSERQGIEIDYCPTCRGIWLDRGELDKLIERATIEAAPRPVAPMPDPRSGSAGPGPTYDRGSDHGYDGHRQPSKEKKGSFLGEIFDF